MKNQLILLFFLPLIIFGQEETKNYYLQINKAITAYNLKDFELAYNHLKQLEPHLFFPDDIRFAQTIYDSIDESKQHEIIKFHRKLMQKTTNINYLFSDNQLLNFGYQDPKNKLKTDIPTIDLPLYAIISKDKYNALLRLKIQDQLTVDLLYTEAASIALKTFREIELPSRKTTILWNDDLNLALSHSLHSLPKDSAFIFLELLKKEVQKGNLYAYQYALLYDEMYIKHYNKSFYGAFFEMQFDESANGMFNRVLFEPIENETSVDQRKQEIFLGTVEDWCKLKKIKRK